MTIVIDALGMCASKENLHKKEVEKLTEVLNEKPKFVIINASDDKGNERYIKGKIAEGTKVGLDVQCVKLHKDCTNMDVLDIIEECNMENIPVILQLPTYDHLDTELLIGSIEPHVDADCFSETLIGRSILDSNCTVAPATPKGVMELLDYHEVEIKGKVALVIGKSNHVGKPLCNMLMSRGATVISANSSTKDLSQWLKQADIVISCVGKLDLIHSKDLKQECVLIGVGFTYIEGKQILDFDLEEIKQSNIPSLVSNRINCTGKATIYALIDNVIELHRLNLGLE